MGNERVDAKAVAEDFRNDLAGMVLAAKRLQPFCGQTSELIEMLALALQNDGQLKLLLSLMPKK